MNKAVVFSQYLCLKVLKRHASDSHWVLPMLTICSNSKIDYFLNFITYTCFAGLCFQSDIAVLKHRAKRVQNILFYFFILVRGSPTPSYDSTQFALLRSWWPTFHNCPSLIKVTEWLPWLHICTCGPSNVKYKPLVPCGSGTAFNSHTGQRADLRWLQREFINGFYLNLGLMISIVHDYYFPLLFSLIHMYFIMIGKETVREI